MASFEMHKKIQKFVNDCSGGLTIVDDISNGGKYGYEVAESPHVTVFGFKTKESVYMHYLKTKFGDKIADILIELISKSC